MKSRLSIPLLIALLAATPVCVASSQAFAGDDDHEHEDHHEGGGDHHEGGGSGGGSGSSGGTGSGSGSSSNSQSGASGNHDDDSSEAQNVVQSGKAVSLNSLLNYVSSNYPGTVINVDLKKDGADYTYQVKLLTEDNKLRIVNLDAKQLKEQNTASIY